MLSLTAGGFGSNRYSLATNSGPEPCVEPPWLWKTIADQQSAARLGRAYLDAHREYRQCHALLTDIERTLIRQDASVSLTADSAQTASALQRLVRKEYARGEVVSVAGWVLSKTEARLYALVAPGKRKQTSSRWSPQSRSSSLTSSAIRPPAGDTTPVTRSSRPSQSGRPVQPAPRAPYAAVPGSIRTPSLLKVSFSCLSASIPRVHPGRFRHLMRGL